MVTLVKHVRCWLQHQWKQRVQCWLAVHLLFTYFLGFPVGYETELVLLLFEPQYAYCAHLCNCCEEKNHYNRLVNLSSCRGFLCRKIKGVCPSCPASLCSVPCCSCALGVQCCLKTRLLCSRGYFAPLPKALQLRPLPSCLQGLLLKNTAHSRTECGQAILNNMAP